MTLIVARKSKKGNYILNDSLGIEIKEGDIRIKPIRKLHINKERAISIAGFIPKELDFEKVIVEDLEITARDVWGWYYSKHGKIDLLNSTIVYITHSELHSLEIDWKSVRHYEIEGFVVSGIFNERSLGFISEEFNEENALRFLRENQKYGLSDSNLEYAVSQNGCFKSKVLRDS